MEDRCRVVAQQCHGACAEYSRLAASDEHDRIFVNAENRQVRRRDGGQWTGARAAEAVVMWQDAKSGQ
ncbi:MAG: hypothetical protein ACTHNK_07295 [Thermomicrobiales bacterium]